MIIFSKSEADLIKGGSMTGKHRIDFYDKSIVANDPGGIFSGPKITTFNQMEDDVNMRILTRGYEGLGTYFNVSCESKEIVLNVGLSIEEAYKILSNSYIKNVNFVNLADNDGSNDINVLLDARVGSGYARKKLCYAKIYYVENELHIVDNNDHITIAITEIKNIDVQRYNYFTIRTDSDIFHLVTNNNAKIHLCKIKKDLKKVNKFGEPENLIELVTTQDNYFAYQKDNVLEIYHLNREDAVYNFPIANIKLFLGKTKLILECDDTLLVCKNNVAKKLCIQLGLVPQKLYELDGSNFMLKQQSQLHLADLLSWIEKEKFYLYSVSDNRLIETYAKDDVKVSQSDSSIIVLKDALLKVTKSIDFLEPTDTLEIFYSELGFPSYFERRGNIITISVPGTVLYEDTVKNFFEKPTQHMDLNIKVSGLNGQNIVMPISKYKNLFKKTLYEAKFPTIQIVHSEKLLVSRARNISDLLLFEYFSQWQIILDYVNQKMKKDSFSEEEIIQYGLYLYHATFQQRKRMEELASKYPQFMYALSQQLTVHPKLNQIYQQQQKEMFQLSAQLKSQFTEIENLLSQITYIHFNNDEYQKRLKAAQKDASMKKVGVATAAGIGITIATGGIGLIIPVMALMGEWSNAKNRKVMDEIQLEKEFKKNEFLFKKSIDLIQHMNDFTLNYYIQYLNQLTYKNLRAEAEILSLDNSDEYKAKLLKQSLDVYTKLSLPIDYDRQLKPDKLVQSILTVPKTAIEKTVTLFLE